MVGLANSIERSRDIEAEARRTWDRAFGARAMPQGRQLGLRSRPVFGWTALREKLLCADLGLNDVVLELLKLGLLRDMESPPLADQTELRLTAGNGDELRLEWLELASERAIEGVAAVGLRRAADASRRLCRHPVALRPRTAGRL